MSHTTSFCIFIVVVIAPTVIQCISVVGPSILRPFIHYKAAIAGGSRAYTLYVAIEGRRANGEQFSQGQEVQIQAAASRIVELDIGDPGPGQYALVARSTAGPQFSSSAPLVYQPRSFCVFVQTDKRIYQPGDVIRFRIIALDKYLLPLAGAVDISVLDSGGSPVRQWAGVALDRGIVSDELQLADEPALGEWTIQVEARGQKYSRQILVADYVMPKFRMDIQIPKQVLFSEGRFTINVTANHFNGLPVQGELTISAFTVFFSGLLQPVFSSPARKVIAFNGNANVIYDLKTDLNLAEDAARPLVVEAVLEEKDTLIRQNVSSKILLLRSPYRLKVTAPEFFKSTLPYNVQIELVDAYGEVLNTDGNVTVEQLWDDGDPVNATKLALRGGRAAFSLLPDKEHYNNTLNLVIKYKEVTERVVNVVNAAASSGQFLTVELLSQGTSVGDEMRVRITSTEPMDLLHYAVIGRGDILLAETLEFPSARRSVEAGVPVSARMAPGCVVLAWYSRLAAASSALLAAAVYAPQRNLLQHQVSVQAGGVSGAGGGRPGGAVELRVRGEAGAHAALLAADARAAAAGLAADDGLGSGLTLHMVKREVESFIGVKHSIFKNDDNIPSLGMDLGGKTISDVFQNSGVVILTDGVLMRNNAGVSGSAESPEAGSRPALAGPYAFSRLPPPPAPRYYLTVAPLPTWMQANFTIGADGTGVETRQSPTAAAEWTVGGFAVHPTLGLGLAAPQRLATGLPLSLGAELPAAMQRGEALAAVVTLTSTLTADTSVEVTFHNSELYFEFEPLENSVDSAKKIELFRRLRVTVPALGSVSTAFLVSAARAGEAPVIVEAAGNGVSASLFRTIDVKDGYEEELWSLSLLDARRGAARGAVSLAVAPGTRLPGGAALLCAGDPLAAALRAARAAPPPAADPAHALRPLALAAVLLDYIQTTERDHEELSLTREMLGQASAGYQRLMAYRRSDGSFAADTHPDTEGDVLSTAVSLRWLSVSARLVPVSGAAGAAAARWLARAQLPGGDWPAPPPAERHNPRAQAPLPLAAHALMALMQAQGSEVLYKNEVNKALNYVSGALSPALDAYSLAVAGAALAAAAHPRAPDALRMMDQYANTTGSTVFWSRKLYGSEWRNPWLRGNSLQAATAAHALRVLLAQRLLERAAPVAAHLLAAFRPHDLDPDVVEALAQYSKAIKTSTKLRVSVNVTGSEEPRQFNIDDDNALIIQTQLVRGARAASALTEGRGVALLGLTARGATNVTAAWPRYTLDPRVDHVSTAHRLQLSICIGFVAQGNETESGLALLTVQLPTGYLADINTLTELTSARHVTAARLRGGGARVLAWVRAARSERCATLAAPRALPVARARAGVATLEDLFDSSHRARVFFHPVASSACDVCRAWPSCARACGSAAQQRAPDRTPPSPAQPARPARGSAAGHQHHTATTAATALLLATVALLQ